MKKNYFLFTLLYPVHAVAWAGFFYYLLVTGLSWYHLLYTAIGWILIEGVGVAVILHRYTSHRAFEIRPFLKPVLLWLACLSLQGSPVGWAGIHRGSHHKHSDTDLDAHTPKKGKMYSWHFWLHDWNKYFNPKYVIDLVRDPMQMWFAKYYTSLIIVTYIIVAAISIELLLFGLMIPAALSLYMESNINVFCHTPNMGYRNFETKDDSQNVPLLAWITWGQGWHNNHHKMGSSYDFGSSVSGRAEEFDLSLLLLPIVATKDSREKIYQARNDKLHSK
jgi:stearoyl-CoA desaturase (delta-9 desaturase)